MNDEVVVIRAARFFLRRARLDGAQPRNIHRPLAPPLGLLDAWSFPWRGAARARGSRLAICDLRFVGSRPVPLESFSGARGERVRCEVPVCVLDLGSGGARGSREAFRILALRNAPRARALYVGQPCGEGDGGEGQARGSRFAGRARVWSNEGSGAASVDGDKQPDDHMFPPSI